MKVRDLPPTAVRLTPELRHALAKQAAINGRSLHAEILRRLQMSMSKEDADVVVYGQFKAHEPRAGHPELADAERRLLTLFNKLSPEKQLALLSLLS